MSSGPISVTKMNFRIFNYLNELLPVLATQGTVELVV
jgi:hypothetical protein